MKAQSKMPKIFFPNLGKNHFFAISDYRNIDEVLLQLGMKKVDAILLDLGLSSDELENSGRGFSFKKNEPLQMTFSENTGEHNHCRNNPEQLERRNDSRHFYGYSDERYARRIAKAIVEERLKKEIKTTDEFVEIIRNAVPASYRRWKNSFCHKNFSGFANRGQ